jgi:hypothetical protein
MAGAQKKPSAGTRRRTGSSANRSAKSKGLIDHDEIRRWAEERGARPARVKGTGAAEMTSASSVSIFPATPARARWSTSVGTSGLRISVTWRWSCRTRPHAGSKAISTSWWGAKRYRRGRVALRGPAAVIRSGFRGRRRVGELPTRALRVGELPTRALRKRSAAAREPSVPSRFAGVPRHGERQRRWCSKLKPVWPGSPTRVLGSKT